MALLNIILDLERGFAIDLCSCTGNVTVRLFWGHGL